MAMDGRRGRRRRREERQGGSFGESAGGINGFHLPPAAQALLTCGQLDRWQKRKALAAATSWPSKGDQNKKRASSQ